MAKRYGPRSRKAHKKGPHKTKKRLAIKTLMLAARAAKRKKG